jgi:formamidopyrimidine-DNA glycosylase
MSGQVLLEPRSSQLHSHVRINIALKNASREIRFRDQRLFGGLHLDTLQGDIPTSVSHIAPDFFDTRFDLDWVLKTLSKRTAGIKSLLLNQNIVSGVGNIYADEALWLAKVHYLTPGNRLSKSRLETLLLSAHEVMAKAIKAGGTSFDDLYVNVNGESGWFELELNAYGREDEPCSRCGRLIAREAWSNRSSYRCPRCQPKPRTAR